MNPGPVVIVLLAITAFGAGMVDAIAGGGGLITLPALLAAGLPPHMALGTNKGQAVWGAGASTVAFWRADSLDRRRARFAFPLGFIGSWLGAEGVLRVPSETLRPLVLVLLVAVAGFLTFRGTAPARAAPLSRAQGDLRTAVLAVTVGAYDGFFGPGTGTFLIIGYVILLGQNMTRASGDAKVVNFASNLAAVIRFGVRGTVVWQIALPMAVGQAVGGWIGAHVAIRRGDRIVRRVVLGVVAVLVVKLTRDVVMR